VVGVGTEGGLGVGTGVERAETEGGGAVGVGTGGVAVVVGVLAQGGTTAEEPLLLREPLGRFVVGLLMRRL
jgi:hypothetical protein